MKTCLLFILIGALVLGCTKPKDPTPSTIPDIVGTWEMASFVVDPPLAGGIRDYLAYQRQIFTQGFQCSDFFIYYSFKADKTFNEAYRTVCASSGDQTDIIWEGSWSLTGDQLSLVFDDGSGTQQTRLYHVAIQPATSKSLASMDFKFSDGGSTYSIRLVKN